MALGDLVPGEYRGPGLSAAELAKAQEEAGTLFPPDLCELLGETLPTGTGRRADSFPDWRHRPREAMRASQERIVDRFHFDVLENAFWVPAWGDRPDDPAESRAVIAEQLAAVPALIPVYSHRAIPNEPLLPGNPVFSMYQAVDTIVYGADLRNYLLSEFHEGRELSHEPREIRFWTWLLDPVEALPKP